jgi:hypothetical protein
MTKLMTVVTIFGLFAVKAHALEMADLQNMTQTVAQFQQVVTELKETYNDGQVKADLATLGKVNSRAGEILEFCKVVEQRIQEKSADLLARKQEARDRAIEKTVSLLDSTDANVLSAQAIFVRNFETAKYCLGLAGQARTSMVQKLEK